MRPLLFTRYGGWG